MSGRAGAGQLTVRWPSQVIAAHTGASDPTWASVARLRTSVQVEPVASRSRRRYAGCSSPEDAEGVDDAPGAECAGAELGRSQVEVLGEEGVAVQRCSAGLEQPASRLTGPAKDEGLAQHGHRAGRELDPDLSGDVGASREDEGLSLPGQSGVGSGPARCLPRGGARIRT